MLVAEGFLGLDASAETPSTAAPLVGKRVAQPREVDGLPGAAGRVGARIEKQHEFLAGVIGERDAVASVAGQLEGGGLGTFTADPARPRNRAVLARCLTADGSDFNDFDGAL